MLKAIDKKIWIGLAVAGIVTAGVMLFLYNPGDELFAPKCLFKLVTGWECPGCGSSRALHHLLHLRLGQAWGYNPLMILAMPLVALLGYLEIFGGRRRFPMLYDKLTSRVCLAVIFSVIVLFWIGRNIL